LRALAAICAALLPLVAVPDTPADARAAERLESALESLSGLRAEFSQAVTDSAGNRIESAEGSVSLARPGRFRWDYREPRQLIVSDGNTVWLYDIDLAQVTVRPAAESLAGTPALLLAGQAGVREAFSITDGGTADGLEWSRLRPRGVDGDFTEMQVGVAGTALKRMRLLDKLGQTTELEFSRIERNPPFAPGTFRFEPPPGVDVVGRAGPGAG